MGFGLLVSELQGSGVLEFRDSGSGIWVRAVRGSRALGLRALGVRGLEVVGLGVGV